MTPTQHGPLAHAPAAGKRGGGGFALLSPAFLDELRARTSLSGLIGRSTKLTKAGNEWKACCPFHQEKSPSFYVNDDKQFYHCFGCGAHGDAIRFLTDARGLEFLDAVKELAAAAGLEMPTPDPATRERAERAAGLHEVMARAASWFREQLGGLNGGAARVYLDKRGLSPATQGEFGFGLAPEGRRHLAEALADIPTAMLIEAGLLIQPEDSGKGGGQPYDRFRGRLMIPINDQRGRVIAFGGRILGEGEPKYLNSPETSLFDKGSTLYNLHRAAPASRKSGRLVIVEGYLDVIAMAQAGIGEVVAPLGTALTERQLERAWGLVDVPILCFDGDSAGRKAAYRAAERAMPLLRPGKSLAFAMLPAGMDPDDLARSGGGAAIEEVLGRTVPLLRLLYERERDSGDMSQPETRAGLRARLNEIADQCADKIVGQEYRRSFSDLFFEEFGFKRAERRAIVSAILHTAPEKGALGRRDLIVRAALYGLSNNPDVLRACADILSHVDVENARLRKWRDTLVGASYGHAPLDDGAIAAILAADGLAEMLVFNLCEDLRFPFLRVGIDEREKREALEGLVVFLNEERELDEALLALDRAARADAGGEGYLTIEAERQYLRDQKDAIMATAYRLGASEQD
ncbi:MAG TPA: DNA primase [Sphingomonas sp.]